MHSSPPPQPAEPPPPPPSWLWLEGLGFFGGELRYMVKDGMLLTLGVAVFWQNRCLPPNRTGKTKKPANSSQSQQLTTLYPRLCIVERRTSYFVRYDTRYVRKKLALG